MPGAGKTSVGRLLAERWKLPFHDTDEIVAGESGRTIQDIFFSDGPAAFRRWERRVIERLVSEAPAIISTGGGAMIEPKTREFLLSRTVTVWLEASAETLQQRLAGTPPRPLLSGAGLLERLQAMEAERRPFDAQAHIRVPADRADISVVADLIAAAVEAA